MAKRANVTNAEEFYESGLKPGDRIHLGVAGPGQVTDDAVLRNVLEDETGQTNGIIAEVDGETNEFPWGDIVELWKAD